MKSFRLDKNAFYAAVFLLVKSVTLKGSYWTKWFIRIREGDGNSSGYFNRLSGQKYYSSDSTI